MFKIASVFKCLFSIFTIFIVPRFHEKIINDGIPFPHPTGTYLLCYMSKNIQRLK